MTDRSEDTSPARVPPRRAALVLAAFLLSGAAALVYEVTWTRALSLVLGSTTYAVSTMLATFMLGLAIGGWLGGRIADGRARPLLWFGLCELGIGLTGIISVPLIYQLPAAYLVIYRALHLHPTLFFVAQIALCATVMALPTLLMGATFPLVTRALSHEVADIGRTVGRIYALNTAGAVLGSIGAGFLLIPGLGMGRTVLVAGGVNLAVGLLLVLGQRQRGSLLALVALLLYGSVAALAESAPTRPALINFYSAPRNLETGPYAFAAAGQGLRRLWTGSYAEGEVTAYRAHGGELVLQVGGKLEGTSALDSDNAVLLAYLPLAAHPKPRDMLVVGLGAGKTLEAARPHLGRLSVIEINPGVVEAVSRFGPRGLLGGVEILIGDARNQLLRDRRRFDLISAEPSYPTEAGASGLFTREHFLLVADRLTERGVACQWLPYYLLRNDDVTMMVKTFASVFPQVYLFRVERSLDLLLLGSRRSFAFSADEIRARVARLNRYPQELAYRVSRTPAQVAGIAARADLPVNTDDLPLLEFRTVRNLLRGRLTD